MTRSTRSTRSTRWASRIGVAGAALLASAAIGTGGALSANAASDGASVDSWSVPQTTSATSATDYWTSARMEAALPGESLIADNIAKAAVSKSVTSAPAAGKAVEVAAPRPILRATRATPVSHIGKVFFTLGGQDYVCSGNALVSANESTVATAGHCVNEGPGSYASRWIFVPAYVNGSAPYGEWTATDLYAPTQWTSQGDISYDTGFAIMSTLGGRTLTDTVGASGVAFNQSRGLSYTAFGYPAASPFNGESLYSCSGRATADPFGQSQSQGIPCNMTGGSSGGPWFTGGSSGTQNSVNSFGYNSVANTMFGPYWGSVIQSAYNAASAG